MLHYCYYLNYYSKHFRFLQDSTENKMKLWIEWSVSQRNATVQSYFTKLQQSTVLFFQIWYCSILFISVMFFFHFIPCSSLPNEWICFLLIYFFFLPFSEWQVLFIFCKDSILFNISDNNCSIHPYMHDQNNISCLRPFKKNFNWTKYAAGLVMFGKYENLVWYL